MGVAKAPAREQLRALAAGGEVEGAFVAPVEVEVLDDATKLRVVVQEGRKHEVGGGWLRAVVVGGWFG